MSDVQRFEPRVWPTESGVEVIEVEESGVGRYVFHSDYEKLEVLLEMAKELLGAIPDNYCPECDDGSGYTLYASMPDGDPIQVQCRWCYERREMLGKVEVRDE